MMLQFIVLGLIPGTRIQITLTWFLIMGIIVDVLVGAFFIYAGFQPHPNKAPKSGTDSEAEMATFSEEQMVTPGQL